VSHVTAQADGSSPAGTAPAWQWWRRSADRQRIEALIAKYRLELNPLEGEWTEPAHELLDAADAALAERKREKAWSFVLASLRLRVFGYGPAELEANRVALRHETEEKLGSWRRATILDLLARNERLTNLLDRLVGDAAAVKEVESALGKPAPEREERVLTLLRAHGGDFSQSLATLLADLAAERIGPDDTAEDRLRLYYALQIRDEHSTNVYRRISLLRWQLTAISAVLVLTLASILVLAAWKPIALTEPPDGPRMWVWVLLFGTLGGCLTSLLSAGKPSGVARIPEQRSQFLVAAARPLVGGAAALFAYALFAAGIVRLGTGERAAALLALAFVAGFSERLVTGAAESVAGGDSGRSA
jgi:hypothetical protein